MLGQDGFGTIRTVLLDMYLLHRSSKTSVRAKPLRSQLLFRFVQSLSKTGKGGTGFFPSGIDPLPTLRVPLCIILKYPCLAN